MGKDANNSLYFKAFNEDYRIGGVYHQLDNSEFRMIVILQAYSNSKGFVEDAKGKAYSLRELAILSRLDVKTTRKCLIKLEELHIIEHDEDDKIYVVRFIEDNTARVQSKRYKGSGLSKMLKRIDDVVMDNTRTVNRNNQQVNQLREDVKMVVRK